MKLIQTTLHPKKKAISWPCPIAQKIPIGKRLEHIKNCGECKRLEVELDEQLGMEKHIWELKKC